MTIKGMTLKDFRELTKDLPEDTLIEVGGRGENDDLQVYGFANMFGLRDNMIRLHYDYFLNKHMGWPEQDSKTKYVGRPISYKGQE